MRLLLVEDHAPVRQALREGLEATGAVQVVAVAATAREAIARVDAGAPRALLEPNELRVVELVAQGLTNEQIAARLGLRDARAVSRTNGRIYDAWRLSESTTDEKVARARATLIYTLDRPIIWDDEGNALVPDRKGAWVPFFEGTGEGHA